MVTLARYLCGPNEHPKLDLQYTSTHDVATFDLRFVVCISLDCIDHSFIPHLNITHIRVFAFLKIYQRGFGRRARLIGHSQDRPGRQLR